MRTLQVMLAPCGTVLAVVGFAVLPSGLLLGWAVIALTVGGLAAYIARDAHATRNPGGRFADAIPHRSPRRIAGVTAVLTYLTVPVLAGTAALLGAAAASTVAVLAVLLAAATLWARRNKHHPAPFIADPAPQRPAPDGEHRPPTAAGVAPDALSALSTPQLCLTWRSSYLRLHRATSCPAAAELVLLRQRVLDELERRDPAGFDRWLSTGARAASDPSRYVGHDT